MLLGTVVRALGADLVVSSGAIDDPIANVPARYAFVRALAQIARGRILEGDTPLFAVLVPARELRGQVFVVSEWAVGEAVE
jgi:hypothetical protein